MSVVWRESSRSPVKLQDCKGSRIYGHCVVYLRRGQSRPSPLSAEARLDMSVAACLPLRPDLEFLLLPLTLSHIPEEDIDFIDRDSDKKNIAAMETTEEEMLESGTRRMASPKMLRYPRHRQRPAQIEACRVTNPLRNVGMVGMDNAVEDAHGYGALRSDVTIDGSSSTDDSENSGDVGSVVNSTAPLFDKVDGWVHSVEQSEKRACDLAHETAELKNHLERLLNEIVTTRNQMCPRAPRFTHPTLGCTAKLQKDSCCQNQLLLSEYIASTNEDDNYERCASMFSMSCEADGSCTSLDDVLSENNTELSDAGFDFDEDIETVLQSIWTTSEDPTKEKEISHDSQMDIDLESSRPEPDSIPEALKSAYDMDTFCQSNAENAVCSAEGEEIITPESDKPRSTSSLFNEREKNKESPSFEELAVVWQSQDSRVLVIEDGEHGISSTMPIKVVSNDCFHEAASVSCQSENCRTEEVQTMNKIEKVNNNGQNASVAIIRKEESSVCEEVVCHYKGRETSKLDLGSLEKRRYPGVIDPTPREFLGKMRVPAKEKEWSSACLAIFQEERIMDDATLLAECEKHLNSSQKQSSGFRFMSWWNSMKSTSIRSDHHLTESHASLMPFGPKNDTSKAVTEFSKQCHKWSRVADRKRSFFGFLLPSFR